MSEQTNNQSLDARSMLGQVKAMIWLGIICVLWFLIYSLTGNVGLAFLGSLLPLGIWAGIGYLLARHQERSSPGAKQERAERRAAFIAKHQERSRRNAT
jgi:hypothetical protein